MSSKMEECKKTRKSFEELHTATHKLINQLEGGADNNSSFSFTTQEYMSFYTTVYQLSGGRNLKPLYDQYKKVFGEYINSTVLPSLREKKDEILLRELLKRWSNYKIITKWLSSLFRYLETSYLRSRDIPSLEETAFLSFYDLVCDEVNEQVMDALLAMIDQERAGKEIDRTLVNDILAVYSEIGDNTGNNDAKYFAERIIKENATLSNDEASNWIASPSWTSNTPKEEKLQDKPIATSKKINLISSDGDVFEIDYDVALMSKTIKDLIETNPVGDIDSIPVSLVSSNMLAKVIEYCKKHKEEHVSDDDLMDWDADFVNYEYPTVLDFILAANYLNIGSLMSLACDKIASMIKGKTPAEIREFFDIQVTYP